MNASKNALNPLILIPARMAATRLPGKPLADINGLPMIVHVFRRAEEAQMGPTIVATDSEEIAAQVARHGGNAIMTDPGHPSGSDRIFDALKQADPDAKHDVIVNLQGDLPTLAPEAIRACVNPLEQKTVDIATIASAITKKSEIDNPNVVKVVGTPVGENRLRALYFTRATAPYGEGPLFHHIGIYAYRRAALEKFVELPPSPLEKREKLEQLRALEAGMRIDVALVDTVPLGVDTAADLEEARRMIGGYTHGDFDT